MNTLRKILIGAGSAALVAGLATAAAAQSSDSASVGINARLIAPLTIDPDLSLEFGTIVAPTAAATVTISTAGARTASDTELLAPGGTAPRAGSFDITGEANQAFNISISAVMSDNTFSVDNFTASGCFNTIIAAGTGTGKTANTGTGSAACELVVGATLNIPANPSLGAKSGTLTTTVDYN
ncbi:DUF4402 domain-containing protein [Phenylobacterium sp. J367]|uniref:DUF4402 domain-containing protein n=1 Tax=Phenylobacterium sp. J367 TaxID=2898435 RepID=UPI0021516DEF|nr:DUF4402 domain-containing protein [Phenylobacterium sp. J367]MCR5880541.1 DUF4402 domain-containing protein [Phenylobacterium sp. J367]